MSVKQSNKQKNQTNLQKADKYGLTHKIPRAYVVCLCGKRGVEADMAVSCLVQLHLYT